jgi:hypothetical protein
VVCGTNVEFKYRSIFREVGKVLVYPKKNCAGKKNPVQLHDTNSVALVQKYGMMLENIPINAVCIPAEY